MDDLRPRLERALAGTYTFERELGGGGMSRTYLAREKALDRRVVVKVLAPELLAGISVERFRREVLLAAQLQHPHVVPVLTAGDTDGLPWFTMPYVDGDSLRQRLAQGPLGIGEIVGILRDVARALAYAHAHGVVHRDIKPDNVLLSAGSATVTDFGIAKAISAARSPEAPAGFGTALTMAGTSIGTPTYMAPEQAVGDPNTDHRADLYSFGAMAYELLAGRPPFHGYQPSALVAAHLSEAPEDVRALRADCPPALAALVMQCLAKQPGDRPQAAGDIARVLDSITSSGAAAAAPAILAGGRTRFSRALAIWAALSAVVTLTAWAATRVIGLPEWALPGAIGVMLAGLPVIVATWYAQKVVHRAYVATPTLTPGGSRVPLPQGTMATLAIKASPHLSWRRTWLGGGIAVGGFAALVVAFLVMRALGIGPFGSLRGRGEFGAQETIVVADFVSPPGDSTLGATVAEALRTDLAQSRALRVLTRANVREVLRLMQRPVESAVLFDLAREIATREGAKAVLDGGIERLGQSYVVSARLVGALNGQELATFRETARSEDELLEALGKLSRAVRDVSGESLRELRASKDLERVTTPSLAALRKYVEGAQVADERGDVQRGLALLQEAVAIDTGFAMAWRKIAVLLGNEGRERARAIAAIERAYAHRDRLSELERLTTEGYYFTRGPRPDRARALAAYEGVMALDSLSSSATNNAAVILGEMREWDRARELYRRVTRLPRSFGGAFTNLMQMQIRTGQLAGLDSTRAEFRKRYPESADLWEADAYAAWGHGDLAATDSVSRAAAATARTARVAIRSNFGIGDIAAIRGRPAEALRHYTLGRAAEQRAGAGPVTALNLALDSIFVDVTLLGRTATARERIAAALRAHPMERIPAAERPWIAIAQLGVMLADPEVTRQAAEGYERDIAPGTADPDAARLAARGARAFVERRYDEAVSATLEADRRFAMPRNIALMTVARAYDAAGQADSAIAYYREYLERRDPFTFDAAAYRAATLRRLGELHEARGDAAKAVEYYQRLVDQWAGAEPVLQPQVAEIRARIERLRKPM